MRYADPGGRQQYGAEHQDDGQDRQDRLPDRADSFPQRQDNQNEGERQRAAENGDADRRQCIERQVHLHVGTGKTAVKNSVMNTDHGQTASKPGQDSPQFFHSLLRREDHRGTDTKRQGDEHAFHPDERRYAHEERSAEKFRRGGMIPEK